MSSMLGNTAIGSVKFQSPILGIFTLGNPYDHYTPSVIPYITSRSEFLTAYTPYQCEISQGTLRYIFEFQSMICALTGMDCANASMYDGATAAAEAAMMAISSTKKKDTILISGTLLPNVIKESSSRPAFLDFTLWPTCLYAPW